MPSPSSITPTTQRPRPARLLRKAFVRRNAPARHRTSIPAGLLGMLALVGAIELVVARHPLDFSDPVSLSWQLSAELAEREAPGCAILGVGDSLVKHAVIPAVIEARTGERTGNLGIARGPAPATYFLLRRALEAGARPRAVIVDYKPGVLVGSPRYNLRYWQEILTIRECLELARSNGGGSLLVEIMLGRLLPSFRSRLEVRGAILAALRGEENPMRPINGVCERNWRLNRGANIAASNPAFHGSVTPEQHKTLLSHLWYCHRVNAVYVRKLLQLTADRGIPVYWLLPPVSPELQHRREETGAEAGYLKFVGSFERAYPHLRVVDARHAGYGHGVFVDPTHLDRQGANTLSIALAELLAKDRAGASARSRRVSLPPFRVQPEPVALEDVEQSKRILKASARP